MTGGGAVLLGLAVPQARAAEVAFATRCVPPPGVGLPDVDGTTKVEITAPATARVGDTVDLAWTFVQAASRNPDLIDLPADSVQPSGTLRAAGAQTADVALRGPRENPPIPKGGAMTLSRMTGTLRLTAAGQVTLTPGAYVVNALSTDTRCTPTGPVGAAATITVTAGNGTPTGTPTGSPTGTPTDFPTGSASPSGSPSPSASPGPSSSGGGPTDFTGDVVDVPYTCASPIGEKRATSPVQINARKNGGSYDLTAQFRKSVMDSPVDIPANAVKPSMRIVLGGADRGSVKVTGPANTAPVKSGDPIRIPDLTGTYRPGATGVSTLAPGVLTIEALGTTTTCTPDTSRVSLTLDTAEQASGASGGGNGSNGGNGGGTGGGGSGGASGGAGTAGSGGGLAETGAGDRGALKALGLLAGTVVLLGGAVLTYLPARRRTG
ncbi:MULTISPECIES: hypothetical protein [unclassified Streptomyces]|uniref:hypothetical protein n=1 Tax=unclassified Streptomyces TaxID=2593676 RepID=UPI003806E5ED